jgi:hypothetical protein
MTDAKWLDEVLDFLLWLTPCEDAPPEQCPMYSLIGRTSKDLFLKGSLERLRQRKEVMGVHRNELM